MECPRCGLQVGNMQVHPEETCERQQAINRKNKGEVCPYCNGLNGQHKDGCPRKKPAA
jgi:hypothetical protein